MFKAAVSIWARRIAFVSLLVIGFSTFAQSGTGSVTLVWDASPDTNVVGYNVYYWVAGSDVTNSIDAGDTTNATINGLIDGTTYDFGVAAYDSAGLDSVLSNIISYTVPGNAPPTITLTAPANGATYPAPAAINLAATVTANSNSITSVQFYDGTTLLGTSTTAPYTYTWSGVSAGSYSLSAQIVYGSASNVASSSVTVTVTNPPPTVALTAPANGAGYLAPASIGLAASVTTNGNTITSVRFYDGTTLLGTITTAPYTYTWSGVSTGSYSLSAKVVYGSGSTAASASVGVTVTNPAPTVALTAPANGASYLAPASIGLAASVTANGNTITSVRFYDGSTLLGSSTTAPYTYTWTSVAASSYTLSAQVVYGSGSTVSSTSVGVTVTNGAPAIVLTTPTNGANYAAPASINLAASVTTNGHTITSVGFYDGTNLLGSATTAPYTFAWTNVSAGTYSLSAQLDYDSSSTLSSSSASVTVHPLPTISTIASFDMQTNTSSAAIPFTVGDVETGASNLTVSATSANTALIAVTNIVFGGSGSNRTVTITPLFDQAGSANITITVSYGVASASTTFQVTVEGPASRPPAPTLIQVSGGGSLSPQLNEEALVSGQTYTVTAVPNPGQQFAGWTGSITSTNPTVTFVMSPGFSFTANFVPSPYTLTSGTFTGLFYETNQVQPTSAGTFTLVVTTRGTYSGHLQIGNKHYSFSGDLGTNGQTTKSISRSADTALNLQLNMGAGNLSDRVFGTLSDGTWVASLTGHRAVFDARTHAAPFAKLYTLILPGQGTNSSLPTGDGYGSVRVTTSGLVMFAGKLADGTAVSQSAIVSAEGAWPLYVPLYSGEGLLTGWIDFTNEVSDDLSGAVSWVKPPTANARYYPAGFTNDFTAVGSAYTRPATSADALLTLTNGMITFSGGALSAAITDSIVLDGSRATASSGANLELNFSPGTGIFSGWVSNPAGGFLSFGGAVFQKTDAGFGFLLDSDQSSEVAIGN